MALVQCNYPGCQQHAEMPDPNTVWFCGGHSYQQSAAAHSLKCIQRAWLDRHRYLPATHPHRIPNGNPNSRNIPACNCGQLH